MKKLSVLEMIEDRVNAKHKAAEKKRAKAEKDNIIISNAIDILWFHLEPIKIKYKGVSINRINNRINIMLNKGDPQSILTAIEVRVGSTLSKDKVPSYTVITHDNKPYRTNNIQYILSYVSCIVGDWVYNTR